jgi:SsrA-binding protein
MQLIAKNNKAHFLYEIFETFEAGMVLFGSEVKSIRMGKVSINEAFVNDIGGELYAQHIHIAKYKESGKFNHPEVRPRKLLFHKREVNKIFGKIKVKGFTAVVMKMYFNNKNMIKLEVGIAKGKTLHDKRQSIKERDWNREKNREFKKLQ